MSIDIEKLLDFSPIEHNAREFEEIRARALQLAQVIHDKLPDTANKDHALRMLRDSMSCVYWCLNEGDLPEETKV